ncbi:MAG: M14 family zinc carboxypeptidase [Candidatus Xenobia bacterium]
MVRRLAFFLALLMLPVAAQISIPLPTPLEATGTVTSLDGMSAWLAQLKTRSVWKMTVTDPTSSTREHLPIWQVHLTPPHGTPRIRVMVLARVHGNEPASTEAALALLRDVATTNTYSNFEFLVFPCINPEGASEACELARQSEGWWGNEGRLNRDDVDINRDYLRLDTPEARTVVSAYDNFKPQVVLDLHEYESRPLVSSGDGWWRAEYWDFLVGTGRAPWAAPSLRAWCRSMTDSTLFPAVRKAGYRAEYYMLPDGNFDSSMHFASNAADYFLVRGSAAFLFETAGCDLGDHTISKRTSIMHAAITALLQKLDEQPDSLFEVLAQAQHEMVSDRQVALELEGKARRVALMGTNGDYFGFESKIDVSGQSYHTHTTAHFTGLDYDVKRAVPLPGAWIVETRDADYLHVLLLHGLHMTEALNGFAVGDQRFPAGTVVVNADSTLAGLLLLKDVQDVTPNALPDRGFVEAAPAGFQMPEGKRLATLQDCEEAAAASPSTTSTGRSASRKM